MKKMVIFKRLDGYYMTDKTNYYSYIQNARAIKKLDGVNTLDDVAAFIENACKWWSCSASDFELAEY